MRTRILAFALVLVLACSASERGSDTSTSTTYRPTALPPPPPAEWVGLLGEYESAAEDVLILLEREGSLHVYRGSVPGFALDTGLSRPLRSLAEFEFESFLWNRNAAHALSFEVDTQGRGTAVLIDGKRYRRRWIEPMSGAGFRIDPVRPVEELRGEALTATPPVEEGSFRESDLVEIVTLDSTIRLDIRYATENNFMGARFYDEPRAFAQREVAEALVRVSRRLAQLGYGILVHDAYRPWYVTKMFWDATPDSLRDFVANPLRGSKHNRGAAIDLSLYDLATGSPVRMVSGYDEFSGRADPDYPGGTSRQRALRSLLRNAMEAEGFTVDGGEWWHFDFAGWDGYRIGNETFDEIR